MTGNEVYSLAYGETNMFYCPAIIFELDANYNQKNIERLFNSISARDLERKIIQLSKDKPMIPWQYQFGDLFCSNIYVGGDEYILGKARNQHVLIIYDDVVNGEYLNGIPEE
jgi:hypothetical protein